MKTFRTISSFALCAIVILVIWRIYSSNKSNQDYTKRILELPINSKVIQVKYENRGGHKYFYDDTFFWSTTFLSRNVQLLNVGDSISKEANSMTLHVYQKDEQNRYVLYKVLHGDANK